MSLNDDVEKSLKFGSFYERPAVNKGVVEVAGGIPYGFEPVVNKELALGGIYGTWGFSYDNSTLPAFVEGRLGRTLSDEESMSLDDLGFLHRHHIPNLSKNENIKLEVEVGAKFLQEAAWANGWEPAEIDGVILGMTGPVVEDYMDRITQQAGISESALKISIHKACDSSVGGLNLALNQGLGSTGTENIAQKLNGKKVLVGGIEGLSRILLNSKDRYALQLFGNGAGIIGLVPGENIKFLVGKTHEVYDQEGVLAMRMQYPHTGHYEPNKPMIEVLKSGETNIRLSGLMPEPENNAPISMAGPMGMVKLFVRTGVAMVSDVFQAYREMINKLGIPNKQITVAIVHHANYKINQLIEKYLVKEGIRFPMPWLLSDFGNVSAASNMIAFLRQLPKLKSGDHVLFDGFGAGTYYDVLVVSLGGA
jgi:3-oxoacyl-[acyl-carrier-protein] synthase III